MCLCLCIYIYIKSSIVIIACPRRKKKITITLEWKLQDNANTQVPCAEQLSLGSSLQITCYKRCKVSEKIKDVLKVGGKVLL